MGVAFLVLFFLIRKVKASTLSAAFEAFRWEYFITSLSLLIPNVLVQAVKWHYLLRLAQPCISFPSSFKSLLAGYSLGFATPARLGELGRTLFIKEIHKTTALRLVIFDKVSNMLVTILFGLVGLNWLTREYFLPNLQPLIKPALGLFFGLIILPLVFPSLLRKVAKYFKLYTLSSKKYLLLLVGSLVFYSIFLTQFLFLAYSFSTVNLMSAASAAAGVFLFKTLLPISIGDLGVREGAAIFFFKKIGLNAAVAFNASFLLFLINVGIPAVFGLWFLLRYKHGYIKTNNFTKVFAQYFVAHTR